MLIAALAPKPTTDAPDGWETRLLGDIGTIVRGSSPRPAGDPHYFNGQFIPWLTVASLTNISPQQLVVTDTATCLTEDGARRSRILPPGTVIIANSGATLGVAKILGIRCCANDGIAAILDQHSGDKAFLCHYLNTQTNRLRTVVAPGNGQPNLNTSLIREIPIPFPPAREQHAIATALGDVDALLDALDNLIAKKRDLKQAAMQQLLTGRSRLPGFTDEWQCATFGEVATIRNAKVIAAATPLAGRCVELDDLAQGSGRLLNASTAAIGASKYSFKAGDVLFGRLRAYLRKYWCATFDGICSTEIWPLMPLDFRLKAPYLYWIVQTDAFAKSAGITYGTHMPRTDWSVVSELEIRLPNADEQSAIATILSDMDAEIAALEARRAKTRDLKQAMMQQLLTGRIRLI